MRRVIVPPNEVHSWNEEKLQELVGKFVAVEVLATDEERGMYGSTWVGGTGIVVSIARQDHPKPMGPVTVIMWDYGMGWQWRDSSEVYLSICDGDETHDARKHLGPAPEAVECEKGLGIRDRTVAEARKHVYQTLPEKDREEYNAWLLDNEAR